MDLNEAHKAQCQIEAGMLLKFFDFQHLPTSLQSISAPFHSTSIHVAQSLPDGPEKVMSLRKLLEAKDCAVRAAL